MQSNPEKKMLRIGICDSDRETVKKYINFLEQWIESKGEKYEDWKVEIFGFLTASEVLECLKQDGEKMDLLLQSIGLDHEKEIQMAEEIQRKSPQLNIVFLTKHIQSHLEIYPWKKMFFCLKADMEQWLPQLMDKMWNEKGNQEEAVFQWESSRKNNIVLVRNILYCERNLRVTDLHYVGGEGKCHHKLDELEEIFNEHDSEKGFCRCHNSFLVNLRHTEKIDKYELRLDDGTSLPISRSHKKETVRRYRELVSKIEQGWKDG